MIDALSPVRHGEVLVCLARRSDVLAAGWSSLAPDERRRAGAIAHPRSEERFRAGRLLLRQAAGRLSGTPAASVVVTGGEGEAPRLGGSLAGLFASVSHGEDTEAVAFAGAPVGIDVEEGCPPDFHVLAPVVMHAAELDPFGRLPDADARVAFRRLWTRKEAVLKAAGMGFSRDPRSFVVGIGEAADVDLDGTTYAVADLPDGSGAVALAGRSIWLNALNLPGRGSQRVEG